jgi:hypothetical protein
MRKQNPIFALVAEFEGYLLANNYSRSTLKSHNQAWQPIIAYAIKNGKTEADENWVMPFIQKHSN